MPITQTRMLQLIKAAADYRRGLATICRTIQQEYQAAKTNGKNPLTALETAYLMSDIGLLLHQPIQSQLVLATEEKHFSSSTIKFNARKAAAAARKRGGLIGSSTAPQSLIPTVAITPPTGTVRTELAVPIPQSREKSRKLTKVQQANADALRFLDENPDAFDPETAAEMRRAAKLTSVVKPVGEDAFTRPPEMDIFMQFDAPKGHKGHWDSRHNMIVVCECGYQANWTEWRDSHIPQVLANSGVDAGGEPDSNANPEDEPDDDGIGDIRAEDLLSGFESGGKVGGNSESEGGSGGGKENEPR